LEKRKYTFSLFKKDALTPVEIYIKRVDKCGKVGNTSKGCGKVSNLNLHNSVILIKSMPFCHKNRILSAVWI
jgi:hypothetical protein